MRIPNKFNGYSRDNIRLYNDPATAAAIAAAGSTTSMAGAATLMSGAAVAGGTSLATGMALGSSLYGGGLGGLTGSGAFGTAAFDAAALGATPAATGIASGFTPASYLANSGLGNALPASQTAIDAAAVGTQAAQPTFQTLTNEGILNSQAFNPQVAQTVSAVPAPAAVPTIPTDIATTFKANPYIAQAPVAPATVAPTTVATTPVAATPVTEVVAEPVSNALVNNVTPEGYKLVTPNSAGAASNVVTEGGAQVANKSGMTGDVFGDLKTLASKPNWANIKAFANENPYTTAAGAYGLYKLMQPKPIKEKEEPQYQRPYNNTTRINPNVDYYRPYSGGSTAERSYFTGGLEAQPIYRVADGGLMSLAAGGTVETMSAANAVGQNMDYPQAGLQTSLYSNPMVQRPVATDVINTGLDTNVDRYTGEERMASGGEAGGYKYDYNPKTMQFTQLSEPAPDISNQQMYLNNLNSNNYNPSGLGSIYQSPAPKPKPFTPVVTGGIATPTGQVDQAAPMMQAQPMQEQTFPAYQTPEQQLGLENFYSSMNQQLGGMGGYQGFAGGGMASLGGYSDGGRLLRGPGDGVSDSIPASIGDRQPARLADGEFVVPARIVSEIGNGSTEAGARKLYAMMERVQGARKKSVGKNKVAVNSNAAKYLPA